MTDLHSLRPFNVRPIVFNAADNLRATHRTAICSYLYIIRSQGTDVLGPTPDYSAKKADLVATGRAAPLRADSAAYAGQLLWSSADQYAQAHRPGEATAIHLVGSLPTGMHLDDWRGIIESFTEEKLVRQGMIADWAIHWLPAGPGVEEIKPHVHMIITARAWDKSRRPGRRMHNWFGSPRQCRDHSEEWSRLTGLYPGSGFELAA